MIVWQEDWSDGHWDDSEATSQAVKWSPSGLMDGVAVAAPHSQAYGTGQVQSSSAVRTHTAIVTRVGLGQALCSWLRAGTLTLDLAPLL